MCGLDSCRWSGSSRHRTPPDDQPGLILTALHDRYIVRQSGWSGRFVGPGLGGTRTSAHISAGNRDLDEFNGDEPVLAHILDELSNKLKSFIVSLIPFGLRSSAPFVHLLVAHPHLDSLEDTDFSTDFSYCRTAQRLQLSADDLSATELRGILDAVPVAKLSITQMESSAALNIILAILGATCSTVTDLELVGCLEQDDVIALLSNCSNLKSIELGYGTAFNMDVVAALSNSCKRLKCFKLVGSVDQHVLEELIVRCHGLTEVTVGHVDCVTESLLQAVVEGPCLVKTAITLARSATFGIYVGFISKSRFVRLKLVAASAAVTILNASTLHRSHAAGEG